MVDININRLKSKLLTISNGPEWEDDVVSGPLGGQPFEEAAKEAGQSHNWAAEQIKDAEGAVELGFGEDSGVTDPAPDVAIDESGASAGAGQGDGTASS